MLFRRLLESAGCSRWPRPGRRPRGRPRRRPGRRTARARRCSPGPTPQRYRAARLRLARALGDRAPGIRVRRLRHLHPHRFQHHLEASDDDGWQAGQRRPGPHQRRRDLLPRASRCPARRAAEGRPAVVRPRRRQGIRGCAHRDHGFSGLAGVRRADWRALRRTPVEHRLVRSINEDPHFPRPNIWPRSLRSPTSSTRRRNTRATRSACCCGSTCRRCRPTPRCIAPTATFRSPGPRATARGGSSTRRWGTPSATWDNPDVYHMYFEALKWSLGLSDADLTPRPLRKSPAPDPCAGQSLRTGDRP